MRMNRKSLLKLLQKLNEEEKYCSARDCAQILDIGVSTFKSGLKEINAQLRHHGAQIQSRSGKGNGYALVISDPSAFESFINETLPEEARKERTDFTDRNKRVSFLIIRFLEKDGFYKSSDLAEQVGLSGTQFSADLSLVRKELAGYGIELKSVPRYGLHAVGDEEKIRACLGSVLLKNERNHFFLEEDIELYPQSVLVRMRKILDEVFRQLQYRESMAAMDSLGIILVVQYYRVKDGQMISYSETATGEIRNLPEYPVACRIAAEIQKTLKIAYTEAEICYMAVHLSTRTISFLEVVSAEADALVSEMLEEAERMQGIDLSDDDRFRQMLRLHTSELLKRIRYGTRVAHPLVADVSGQLIEAYGLAAVFASVIYRQTGVRLSAEETGYYAMHAEIALDRKRISRKNVLLVNAGMRSNTELLRYSFEKKFHDLTERLDVCDVIELKKTDLSVYDAVFSTVDIGTGRKRIKCPVYTISPLIRGEDRQLVREVLTADGLTDVLETVFPANLFMADIEGEGKDELIRAMCRCAEKYGLDPEVFEDSVRQREQFGRTVYENAVFLHPLQRMGEKSFLAAAVLKRPVSWDRERVQLILLGNFSPAEIRENSRIMRTLAVFLNDRKMTSEAIAHGSYRKLTELLQGAAKHAR